MKYLPTIAGILLGLLFVAASVPYLLHKMPESPAMPPDATTFMTLFASTGYMTFIKVLELLGGILVAIPRTRNFGLLVLGPIIVNILAFSIFIMKGVGLVHPMTAFLVIVPAYLLWAGRKAFAGLLNP